MVSVGDAIDTRQDLEDLVLFDLGMDGIDPIRMKERRHNRPFIFRSRQPEMARCFRPERHYPNLRSKR